MFIVLSSWQSHCESSPGSFDECRMAPSGRRPKTKRDDLDLSDQEAGMFFKTGSNPWYQFVRNDDVRRLTKQPKLTAIIQSRRLTLFGHIMRIDDNADAKRILLASPPADWRRQPGRPHITWLSIVQQDLK